MSQGMNAAFVMNANDLELADGAVWAKAEKSGPNGNCVEVVKLKSGDFAMRNSRATDGPALIFTAAEMDAHGDAMAKDEHGVRQAV